jgi:hypothetical protein
MKRTAIMIVCLFFVVGMPLIVDARVNVNIGVALPPLVFAGPPDLVVVPGAAYVYMVPDMAGLYFYGGFWYRIYDGRWYRSRLYSGPWNFMVASRVPRVVVGIPPDYYRHFPAGYHRIPWGDVRRNWRAWDSRRHWNGFDWYRNEFREHERRFPGRNRPPDFERHRPPRSERGGPPEQRRRPPL